MNFETISAGELDRYIGREKTVIVDLRRREEYRKKHIRGAVNFPYEERKGGFPYSVEKEYILYCERGSVSMAAARELAGQHYRVKTVVGGIRAYRGRCLEKGI